jgi:hypothetical protein
MLRTVGDAQHQKSAPRRRSQPSGEQPPDANRMALIAAAHAAEIEVLDSRTTEAINGRLVSCARNPLNI